MPPADPDRIIFPMESKEAGPRAGLPRAVAWLCLSLVGSGFSLVAAVSIGLSVSPRGPSGDDWQLGPFSKYAGNPILSPIGDGWQSKDVFNPAAWTDGQKVALLYRAEDRSGIGDWNGTSRIGLAWSSNGLQFEREEAPVLEPGEAWELPGGCEDPRVVKIGDLFYLTYTAYDGKTARLALAVSSDLRKWSKRGPVFPDRGWTKSGAILDRPVQGRYWMYFGDTDVWAAWSRDLLQWNVVAEPVLRRRPGGFDSRVVEPGPPPVWTERGIVLLYNGADDQLHYSAGQALFDPNDPTRVLERPEIPFLAAQSREEKEGQVPDVVFVEGLVRFQGRWLLYFGMGDSHIGVAVSGAGPRPAREDQK